MSLTHCQWVRPKWDWISGSLHLPHFFLTPLWLIAAGRLPGSPGRGLPLPYFRVKPRPVGRGYKRPVGMPYHDCGGEMDSITSSFLELFLNTSIYEVQQPPGWRDWPRAPGLWNAGSPRRGRPDGVAQTRFVVHPCGRRR